MSSSQLCRFCIPHKNRKSLYTEEDVGFKDANPKKAGVEKMVTLFPELTNDIKSSIKKVEYFKRSGVQIKAVLEQL